MPGSRDTVTNAAARRRLGPLGLIGVVVLALVLLWLFVEIWLHLLGIAASPLGWILSLIGTLVGLVTAKMG